MRPVHIITAAMTNTTPNNANAIAAKYLEGGNIPVIMNTAEEAIQLAVRTLLKVRPEAARIVRIKNTLEITDILVSETLLPDVEANPQMSVV